MSRSESVKLAYDLVIPSQEEDVTLPPVFLLHGMTSSRRTWFNMPQIIADATKRKVYALDARNHGESDWTDECSYGSMAKDLENFMNEESISQAAVVGHSMGGKTAMLLALSAPEKVEKLVVEDISPKTLPPKHRRFPFRYLKLMRQSLYHVPEGSDLDTAREIIAEYIKSRTPEEHRSRKAAAYRGSELPLKMTGKGVAWQTNIDAIEQTFFNQTPTAFEGVYDGEVLFIYGTESVYEVDKGQDVILELFPKAVLSAVEGATHLVHLEFPEEFSAKIIEFLGKK